MPNEPRPPVSRRCRTLGYSVVGAELVTGLIVRPPRGARARNKQGSESGELPQPSDSSDCRGDVAGRNLLNATIDCPAAPRIWPLYRRSDLVRYAASTHPLPPQKLGAPIICSTVRLGHFIVSI